MKVFLDTETTDFTPGQIAQLSYIITDDHLNYIDAKNFYFTVDSMTAGASKRTGLTKPLLNKLSIGKRFNDHRAEIYEDLNGQELICHNAGFDCNFLNKEFSTSPGPPFAYRRSFCTMEYFTDICKLPPKSNKRGIKYKWPKLSEVLEYLYITSKDVRLNAAKLFGGKEKSFKAHDSRYDATAVYMIYKKGFANKPIKISAATRRSTSEKTKKPTPKLVTTLLRLFLLYVFIKALLSILK